MPYIKPDDRKHLDEAINHLGHLIDVKFSPDIDGAFNYAVSRLICICYGDMGDINYKKINAAIGVLECIKQEYYRRVAGPYEDNKKEINGDVY